MTSVVSIDCRHPKNGKKWRKKKTKCQVGEGGTGVLDMDPGFAGKWGYRMRVFECRQW